MHANSKSYDVFKNISVREAQIVQFWTNTNVFVVVVVVLIYSFHWKQRNLHYKNDI